MLSLDMLHYFASIFLVLNFNVGTCSTVPALIWTKGEHERLESVAVPLAGHTLSSNDLLEGYLEVLADGADVAVFLQESLSLEDITTYSNIYNDPKKETVFKSLKQIMENYDGLHLPKVQFANDAVKELEKTFAGKTQRFNSIEDMKNIHIEPNQRNLLIFDLRSGGSGNHALDLAQSDKIIGEITKNLAAESSRFVALFTGKESTKTEDSRLYYGRHLLAEEEPQNETLFNFTNCATEYFYMYATSVELESGGMVMPLPSAIIETKREESETKSEAKCLNNFTTTFKYPEDLLKSSNFSAFSLTLNVSIHSDGYWYVDKWNVNYTTRDNSVTEGLELRLKPQTLFAVANRSYYCGTEYVRFKKPSASDTEQKGTAMIFKDLQMQFKANNTYFDKKYFVNTCEGFFTIPILSGLMVLLLFSMIIFFGMCMLSSMKTMDRFDDPRGRPLQINASD